MKTNRSLLISAFFFVWGLACMTYAKGRENRGTLYVVNDGLEVVKVYDPYARLGTVMPGEKRCLSLEEYSGDVHLYLVTGSEQEQTPYLNSGTRNWTIRIGPEPLRFGAITLQPSEACNARQRTRHSPAQVDGARDLSGASPQPP